MSGSVAARWGRILSQGIPTAWPVLFPIIAVLVAIGIASNGNDVLQREAVVALINLVVVVGLYVFAGTSGVLSFGHISFMAMAAYVTALLTVPKLLKQNLLPHIPSFIQQLELDPVLAAAIAALVCAVFALVLSIPLMRLSGLTASVAMFAVLLIVYEVAKNWIDVTRGTLTMIGVPVTVTLESATATAVAVIVVAYLFQQSKVGLRLRASREDEAAAKAVGIDIAASRRIAFVLSAAIVGIGGFEYAQFYSSFNPDAFYLSVTFITIAMLVVGGMLSLGGAVIGVVGLSALLEILRQVQEGGVSVGPVVLNSPPGLREVGAAVVMLIVLILRPDGLVGSREISWSATTTWLRRIWARVRPGVRPA
jgi:branched-chain amino acid transport system permease protein